MTAVYMGHVRSVGPLVISWYKIYPIYCFLPANITAPLCTSTLLKSTLDIPHVYTTAPQTNRQESMQPKPAATPPSSLWSPFVRSKYPASSLCNTFPLP